MSTTQLAAPPVPAGLRGAARGGLANLFGAVTGALAGFAVTWLVARALGPGHAGGFFAATAAFTILGTVAKLGTETGLVYFTARLRTLGADAALYDCLRVALIPVAVAAGLTALGMWLGAPALARLTDRDGAAGYVGQLRVLALFLPASVLCDTLLAGTRGWRFMRPTVVLDKVVRPAGQLLLIGLLLLLTGPGPAVLALAWAAPYLPSAVLAGYALSRLTPARRRRLSPTRRRRPSTVDSEATAGRFWRFTAPRAAASVAQLALGRVDVLLLGALAGLKAAAIYAVAGRFIVLGQFANQAISQAVQPRLAELLARDDRAGARAMYQAATGWLVLAAWPMYLGLAAFPTVYLGLFGHGYTGATAVVVVLALAMVLATGCGMVDMVLAMAGRTSWNLYNVGCALGVNLAVDLVLIPRLGALGAAIGLAASIATNNLIPLAQIGLALRLHPFGAGTCTAAAAALAFFGALPLGLSTLLGDRLGVAVLAAGLAVAGYLAVLLRLRSALRLDVFLALRTRRST